MNRFFPVVLSTLGLLTVGGGARATGLNFSVSYPLTARAGLTDFPALGGRVAAGLSTRGADLSYSRGLSLAPLGALNTSTTARLAWGGGGRLETGATGALGPVALNLSAALFSTAATTFDPLAGWALEPTDLRSRGWTADLTVRYRVSRQLVAVAGSELGGQWNVFGGIETRRDLTRTLPPAEGDDPAAPPETEKVGTLTYRLGARAGKNVLGATAGIGYATETGRTLALDAQFGPARNGNSGLGLVASASFAELLGEGSTLKTYAAYEPWRENASPLRLGVEASRPLGRGTLSLKVAGGQNQAGQVAIGTQVGYAFTLGGQADLTEEEGDEDSAPDASTPDSSTPDSSEP